MVNNFEKTPFEIFVWEGEYGLLSADPDCLSLLIFCVSYQIPIKVVACVNPRLSPTGELPYLKYNETVIGGVHNIIDYFRKNGYDKFHSVNKFDSSKNFAMETYFLSSMLPACTYVNWFEPQGFTSQRCWLSARLPWALRITVPQRMRKARITKYLSNLKGISPTFMSEEFEITKSESTKEGGNSMFNSNTMGFTFSNTPKTKYSYAQVEEKLLPCLNDINSFLADTDSTSFFYGKLPYTIDAFLYGYITYIKSHSLFKDTQLLMAINQCTQLCDYVTRLQYTFLNKNNINFEIKYSEIALYSYYHCEIPTTFTTTNETLTSNSFDSFDAIYQESDHEDDNPSQSWYSNGSSSTADPEDEKNISRQQNIQMITSTLFAMGAMAGYAYLSGILRFKR